MFKKIKQYTTSIIEYVRYIIEEDFNLLLTGLESILGMSMFIMALLENDKTLKIGFVVLGITYLLLSRMSFINRRLDSLERNYLRATEYSTNLLFGMAQKMAEKKTLKSPKK